MSVLSSLYNKTFNYYEYKEVSGYINRSLQFQFTGTCLFRPINDTINLLDSNNLGKEFNLFTDSDYAIQENGVLMIDSNKFGVNAVNLYEDLEDSSETHLEIRVTSKP